MCFFDLDLASNWWSDKRNKKNKSLKFVSGRMTETEICELTFINDTILIADSEQKLECNLNLLKES